MFVGLYASTPVALRTLTHRPTRRPEPSRLRSWTVAYSERGTAVAESFWSLSDWSPEDWTGLTLKTLPVPTLLPLGGFFAAAGAASARPVTRQAVAASTTVGFL